MLGSNYSQFVIANISYDGVLHRFGPMLVPFDGPQSPELNSEPITVISLNYLDITPPLYKNHHYPPLMSHPTHPILIPHLTRLLSARTFPKTLCPSEVARALSPAELTACNVTGWRDLMDDVRALAWDMRERGEVEVLQGGVVFERERGEIRGPMRIRLKTGSRRDE